jgi:hypothetical protein
MTQRRRTGPHERAVKKDLARVAAEDRAGGLAQLALNLARRLDEDSPTLRDLSAISAQFHAVLLTLSKLQEPAAVLDPVDELEKRRRRRLGSAAG